MPLSKSARCLKNCWSIEESWVTEQRLMNFIFNWFHVLFLQHDGRCSSQVLDYYLNVLFPSGLCIVWWFWRKLMSEVTPILPNAQHDLIQMITWFQYQLLSCQPLMTSFLVMQGPSFFFSWINWMMKNQNQLNWWKIINISLYIFFFNSIQMKYY